MLPLQCAMKKRLHPTRASLAKRPALVCSRPVSLLPRVTWVLTPDCTADIWVGLCGVILGPVQDICLAAFLGSTYPTTTQMREPKMSPDFADVPWGAEGG